MTGSWKRKDRRERPTLVHPANIGRADAKRKWIFNRRPHGYRYRPQVSHDVGLPSALTSALVRKRRLAGRWGRTALSHITPFGMAKSVLLFDPTRAVTARALRLVQSQTSKRPLRLPEHGLARVEDRTQNVSRILQKGGLPTLLRFCASSFLPCPSPILARALSCAFLPLRRHRRRPFVAALRPGYDPQIIDPRSRVVTLRRVTISTASVVTVS